MVFMKEVLPKAEMISGGKGEQQQVSWPPRPIDTEHASICATEEPCEENLGALGSQASTDEGYVEDQTDLVSSLSLTLSESHRAGPVPLSATCMHQPRCSCCV